MSIKAKAPKEDPETKARREAAEKRADAGRIASTQDELSQETLSVIRRFGRLSAFSGQRSLANNNRTGINTGALVKAFFGGRNVAGQTTRPTLTQFA